MDEAHDLGRGKHLDKYGYETVDVIMKRHLARIVDIANKYGYDLMIWSDMYFRPWNNGTYSIPKTTVPKEYIDALPETVIPVYWDYYSNVEQNYSDMMENHKQLSKRTWFAGGCWTWGGFLEGLARPFTIAPGSWLYKKAAPNRYILPHLPPSTMMPQRVFS